ncbi:hypothetical protein N2597_14755 [Rhizobium sophoriradicis]|uniref:hypothetical protein n=1 Tax=Rhizobium sophoriradicis TaxID=1535245 RepID=UPI000BBDCA0A|nr:hypothetical protein [Rhizobium sophoriradicis]PCK88466.1 hypothetical protein CPT32_02415 [Rhizobium sophoriradicis]UWU33411.1 hypothetical protein N2597_14755 [Rhizobium leguminosarum bv. phaseoli]
MDCFAIEEKRSQPSIGVFKRVAGLLVGRFGRLPRLDLDAAPDRIKRDLGFLDGRDPFYEDVCKR